jgi:AraC-like DNA-binding protein
VSDDRQLSDEATVKGLNKLCFEHFMAENKPFLNPDLRIADLAAELNVNRTTLSVFINETYQMNYSCFINGYRYETFKQLVKQPENAILTKSALAERAGFHSYRSLLRYQNKGTTHEN